MKISIIVAKGKNNVIGKDNDLPWHLPGDLRHFKKTTTGHHLIMGRKTYESLGRPLPNRISIVLTRNKEYTVPEGHYVVHDLSAALEICNAKRLEQVYVLGGAEIFKIALPYTDELVITEVDASPEGDTFFPAIEDAEWLMVSREGFPADEKNEYNYSFVTYQRK